MGQLLYDINNSRIQVDPDIGEEMKRSWDNYNFISDDRKPSIFKIPDEEGEFINNIMTIFYKIWQ